MTEAIKSGRELLDEFFENIGGVDGVDHETAAIVKRLYNEGKLTPTNITNALSALREGEGSSEAGEN